MRVLSRFTVLDVLGKDKTGHLMDVLALISRSSAHILFYTSDGFTAYLKHGIKTLFMKRQSKYNQI